MRNPAGKRTTTHGTLARALGFSIVALALCSCRRVTHKEIIGYQGPARQDPFLAAERFLQKERHGARVVNHLKNINQHRGPIIAAAQSFINYGDADAMIEWIEEGGHLILLIEGTERWHNDWKENSFFDSLKARKPEAEETKLLAELGITHDRKDGDTFFKHEEKYTAMAGSRTLTAELSGKFTVTGDAAGADVRFGNKDAPSLASFTFGKGRVTVLANARPFRNRWIGEQDHAVLLATLVDLGQRGEAWFLNGTRVSFWKMLWEHGWMALVALAAIFVVWLWKNFPRLGPLREPTGDVARDFTTHLALTGAFLWRHHEPDALLQPLRDTVTAAAVRLGWHTKDPDFIAKIADRCGLTKARTSFALETAGVRERNLFLRITQDLQKMAEELRAKTIIK